MHSLSRYAAALLCIAVMTAHALEHSHYVYFNGVKIHYIERGNSEPIALLHGGTSSLESWLTSGFVANLEKDFRVIAFDARGAGKIDKPRDPKAYGRQQALDVPRLLDSLKIE